jgi:membrane associated rhomboid family serine protease
MVYYELRNSQEIRKNSIFNLGITMQIILVNVFLFILFYAIGLFYPGFIEKYIAISSEAVFNNYYVWTFLTSMFMHGGIFHLFVNMLSLVFVGSLVEKLIGRKRFFWFYILSGIFAGLLHIIFESAPAVGASGALFGIIGLLMILTPNLPVYMMFIPIPIKLKYAAPIMLILLWAISLAGNVPIGNIAHLGGLIFGLGYGLYLRNKFPNKTRYIRGRFL